MQMMLAFSKVGTIKGQFYETCPVSGREHMLLACAFMRATEFRTGQALTQKTLAVAEKYADREVEYEELAPLIRGDFWMLHPGSPELTSTRTLELRESHSPMACVQVIHDILGNPFRDRLHRWDYQVPPLKRVKCLRCGMTRQGYLQRSCEAIHRNVLTPEVVDLANAAYHNRVDGKLDDFRLGILADALEEAGCTGDRKYACEDRGRHSHEGKAGTVIHGVHHETDPRRMHHHHDEKCPMVPCQHPAIEHLKKSGPHWLGCWALDAILGKD
jgi:hypothetical protein